MKTLQRMRPVMNMELQTSTEGGSNGSKEMRRNKQGTNLLPVLGGGAATAEAAYHEIMSDANATETKDIKSGGRRPGNGGQHTLMHEYCG